MSTASSQVYSWQFARHFYKSNNSLANILALLFGRCLILGFIYKNKNIFKTATNFQALWASLQANIMENIPHLWRRLDPSMARKKGTFDWQWGSYLNPHLGCKLTTITVYLCNFRTGALGSTHQHLQVVPGPKDICLTSTRARVFSAPGPTCVPNSFFIIMVIRPVRLVPRWDLGPARLISILQGL